MKKNLLRTLPFFVACLLQLAATAQKLSILIDPGNGAPGDIVQIKISGASDTKGAEVMIGDQNAIIFASSDNTISVMVPPMPAQKTTLVLQLYKQKAKSTFIVNGPATVRLWFSMKDGKVSFYKSQYTNEEYVQDESSSEEKMMYEITDGNQKTIAVGYINNPAIVEVPSEKEKGFSMTEVKEELKFSITVPVLTSMSSIKLSMIGNATKYKPALVATLPVSIK